MSDRAGRSGRHSGVLWAVSSSIQDTRRCVHQLQRGDPVAHGNTCSNDHLYCDPTRTSAHVSQCLPRLECHPSADEVAYAGYSGLLFKAKRNILPLLCHHK